MSARPRIAFEKSAPGSASATGLPPLTAIGTARSLGSSTWTFVRNVSSTSLRLRPTFVLARFRITRIRSVGKESSSSVCRPEPDVLDRRDVEPAEQEQEYVGAVERRQHRPVEERRRVDDDHVVGGAGDLEQPGQLALGDELGVLRPDRGGQDVEPARMLGRVAGQLLGVQLARGDDEVVDRLLGLEAEHDRGVPELEVEVEQEGAFLVVLREGGREVRGHEVLPIPPLGENTVATLPTRLAPLAERFSAWQALRIAKTMFSVSCGSGTTSATSASSASARMPEHSPEQSRITGARVYSRIAE